MLLPGEKVIAEVLRDSVDRRRPSHCRSGPQEAIAVVCALGDVRDEQENGENAYLLADDFQAFPNIDRADKRQKLRA